MRTEARKMRGKVLIMDDEEIILMALEAVLQTLGYSVVVCSHGQEVLDLIADVQPEIAFQAIILDLTIRGGLGGIDIIADIRNRYPRTCIFAASGNAHDPVMVNPDRYGFTGRIYKPFRIQELAQLLS